MRALLIAHRFLVANQGRGMRYRPFIKYGLLAFLVMSLGSGFILRHKVSMAAQLWLASGEVSGLQLNDGDLIFQTSRSSQSAAIQHATGSIWSHRDDCAA
jgi:hypothetical protein